MAMAIRNNERKYQECGEIVCTSKTTTCSICYMKKSSNIECSKGHSMCNTCTNKYVGTTLLCHRGGFDKEEIECPTDGCKEHLGWKPVRELLSHKTMGVILTMWRSQMDNKKAAEMDPETEKTISCISKKCPSCQVSIEKDGGCDHVRCRCGKNFYYSCLCDFPRHNNTECESYVSPEIRNGLINGPPGQELLAFSERVRLAADRLRGAIGGISDEQIEASRREMHQRSGRPSIRMHEIQPVDAEEARRAMRQRRLQHLVATRAGMMSRLERINREIDGLETETT